MSETDAYSADSGYQGAQSFDTWTSQFNTHDFHILQAIAALAGLKVVKVMACTNAGAVSPVGSVDVMPMVNQIDGFGNSTPHGVIYGVPYFRLQGGANAIIMDPHVGDIGFMNCADRDISSVKSTKAQANPGSRRMWDAADGVYVGGILNGTPTQYIEYSASGITITSPGTIVFNAAELDINAPIVGINATTGFAVGSPEIDLSGTSLTHNSVNVGSTHVHGGVETGADLTLVPQ